MAWPWVNIDWTATNVGAAAWTQAIGSIFAIGAAVWIDRGSARRQESAEERAISRAKAERRRALTNAADALDAMAREIRNAVIPTNAHFIPSQNAQRSVVAAQDLIEFYLHDGRASDALLIVTLAHTRQVLVRAREVVTLNAAIFPSSQVPKAGLIEGYAGDIRQLIEEYDGGVW